MNKSVTLVVNDLYHSVFKTVYVSVYKKLDSSMHSVFKTVYVSVYKKLDSSMP